MKHQTKKPAYVGNPSEEDIRKAEALMDLREARVGRNPHKGAWAKLIACAWLIEKGYSVFHSVVPAGPVDVVGLKDGVVTLFDVKTMSFKPSQNGRVTLAGGEHQLRESQARLGVQLLYVTPDGICSTDANWIRSVYRELS